MSKLYSVDCLECWNPVRNIAHTLPLLKFYVLKDKTYQ